MELRARARLVAIPALISLGVTLLRLIGERRHWSPAWFSPATGGVVPSGMSWLVGITWLAVPFGAWFAWRLQAAGDAPPSAVHALGHAVYVGMPAPFQLPFWPRFLWLALFPQLVFWVGFTILAGSFAGSLVALAARRRAAVAPAGA